MLFRSEAMPEDSAADVQAKAQAYADLQESVEVLRQRQAADFWTAAFFWKIIAPARKAFEIAAPTQGQIKRLRSGREVQAGLPEQVRQLSRAVNFFHWPLEFAEAAAAGGFDCVLGNPPWEMLQLEEQEFFASRDPEIALLPGEKRKHAIRNLQNTNPILYHDFENAKHLADAHNKFFRSCGRFVLTATGKMNSYALFAEHFRSLMSGQGRAGVIVPTGIATDDTTKDFFGDLVEKRSLASLFDFENKEAIFPGVHRSYKFCLLTLSGQPVKQARFVFFATRVEHLRDERRRFTLDPAEIALFNPNTRTMPVFRTRADAELTRAIYRRVPVLVNERTGENPWGVSFKQGLFNMTSDSGLFVTEPREGYVRLYEDWMIHLYDHRFQTDGGHETTEEEHQNPEYLVKPRYWVPISSVHSASRGLAKTNYLIGFRNRTRSTDMRSVVITFHPYTGVGNTTPVIFTNSNKNYLLLANLASLILDFYARFKIPGMNLNFFIFKQFPVLPQIIYHDMDCQYVKERVLELAYTAYDLTPFAVDMGFTGKPFLWDEDRRAVLRAELDAYYARLYGLNRKQLRYILDPADLTPRELEDILDPWEEVADPLDPAGYDARRAASDFPGETFRVLKEKELRQYGEYRTRRLVLEAWDRLEGVEVGNPDGYPAQSAAVSQKQETILVPQPKSESRPAVVQTQLPAPAKPNSPVKPPAKVVKAIDPPADQPTLSDFGLYKCEVCGKMVMGFEKANHEQEKHGGKSVDWKKVR